MSSAASASASASASDPMPGTQSPRSAPSGPLGLASPSSHVVLESEGSSAAAPPPPGSPADPPLLSDSNHVKPVENVCSSSGAAPALPDSEIPDHGNNGNVAPKLVWKVPSNGFTEVGSVAKPSVMGAAWPALSECTKASPKSSSCNTLKNLSDGPVSAPMDSVISSSLPKPNVNNESPNSAPSHTTLVRHKSMKRTGGGASSNGALPNGGPALPSPPAASAVTPEITPDEQVFHQPSPRGLPNITTITNSLDHGSRGGGFMTRPHGPDNYHRNYSGNRRGNNGGRGAHHHNYGNRRDWEHGGYGWNHGNFSGRNVPMQQMPLLQGVQPYPRSPSLVAQPYPRPPSLVSQPIFAPPQQFIPLMSPIGLHDTSSMHDGVASQSPETFRDDHFVHQPPPYPMFVPMLDPHRVKLLTQINYYFSYENLCKDIYLRKKMDNQGWVPIALIAGFTEVRKLTNNIPYILDTMRLSNMVELQGEKIRKRVDWMRWLLPPTSSNFSYSYSQSPVTPNSDTLEGRFQAIGLDGATKQNSMRGPTHNEVFNTGSASGNHGNQLRADRDLNGGGNGLVTDHIDSDGSNFGNRNDTS